MFLCSELGIHSLVAAIHSIEAALFFSFVCFYLRLGFPAMIRLRPPDFAKQPILVIEIPREFIHPNTSRKFFNKNGKKPPLKEKICPARWEFISQFLFVYTKSEQVSCSRRNPSPLKSIHLTHSSLSCNQGLLCVKARHSSLPGLRRRSSVVC